MGGPGVDNLRNWCRHQWSRFNAPCVVSDTVAPDTIITLNNSSSHTSVQSSTLPLPHCTETALWDEHTNRCEGHDTIITLNNSSSHTSVQSSTLPLPHRTETALWDEHTHRCKSHKPNRRRSKSEHEVAFFTEYGDATRYILQEVIGKGSYGVVCSAIDTHTGERVAIKKITNIFEHVSDATRILREIKLLRLLRHPNIVELKHIMLPPSRKHFKDIYVVFELMESDLHEVIKANRDLTREHCRFFLYQLLRAIQFIHTANVFHRDLKPKNVLANADCSLKICDFGLARVAFNGSSSSIFWTDYVATRWYRAPELCGSFFSQYTPAVDIWSVGCIFAEVLLGKPLFPGKNVIHQLDLITDLLGTPPPEAVAKICNEKARCCLAGMPKKNPVPFSSKFPNADPAALTLLNRILAFDPKDRPTAEEALSDPYFKGMSKPEGELRTPQLTKAEFDFEHHKMSKEDVKEHIYREILEYHPQMLTAYLLHGKGSGRYMYLSTIDNFNRQFSYHQEKCSMGTPSIPFENARASLSREEVLDFRDNQPAGDPELENPKQAKIKVSSRIPQKGAAIEEVIYPRRLFKSASVNGYYTGFGPKYMNRNASLRSAGDIAKREDSTQELGKLQRKSHSLGFQVAKTIQALRNSLMRS